MNKIPGTMKSIRVRIFKIDKVHGVIIPNRMLVQAGLAGTVQISIKDGALVLRKPPGLVRVGWADAAKKIAQAQDDRLIMGESVDELDQELPW
jgi:hypothetical protein